MSGCLTEQQVAEVLDGRTSDADEDRIDAHLRECAPCLERLNRLTIVPDDLRGAWGGHVEAPDESELVSTLRETVIGVARRDVPGYEILSELGRGGSGVVFRARRLADGAIVALKTIIPMAAPGPEDVARLRLEARAVSELRHPNIVAVHDVIEREGGPVLCMELVAGIDLAERLGGEPQLPEDAAGLVEILGRAVHVVHEAGFLHRDLKPANVLLQKTAERDESVWVTGTPGTGVRPKITDFGLAKDLMGNVRLTTSRTLLGTPRYMSPEQARGGGVVTRAADVWSLGAILYEVLVGRSPFDSETVVGTMAKVIHEEPVPPRRLVAGIPVDLAAVCLKCLEKRPALRYATAQDLAADLRRFLEGRRTVARPRTAPFVGREGDLRVLRSAFDRAAAGRGGLVLIEGEIGIGKSRLVEEFLAGLRRAGTTASVFAGAYPPGGAAVGSEVFAEVLRMQHDETSTDSTPVGPEAILRALDAATAECPVVLWIDDVECAPDEGRALLAAVAASLSAQRTLLIATALPDLPEAWLSEIEALPSSQRHRLRSLAAHEIEALVTDAVGSESLARSLQAPAARHCGGSPLCVLELLSDLRSRRVLVDNGDGTWRLDGEPEDVGVPESLRLLVESRVARLAEEDRTLLEVAACAGATFDPALVADALGRDGDATRDDLARISRRHGLVQRTDAGWCFEPPLMEHVLHDALTVIYREGYRAALAEARLPGARD